MYKACSRCGKIHKENACTVKVVCKRGDSRASKFRRTYDWQIKRRGILERDKGLCRLCLQRGYINIGQEVHHIVPLSEDYSLRLVDTNLITLCQPCHAWQVDNYDRESLIALASTPPTLS